MHYSLTCDLIFIGRCVQEELGYGWTWLDDVTAKDWQRERAVCVMSWFYRR